MINQNIPSSVFQYAMIYFFIGLAFAGLGVGLYCLGVPLIAILVAGAVVAPEFYKRTEQLASRTSVTKVKRFKKDVMKPTPPQANTTSVPHIIEASETDIPTTLSKKQSTTSIIAKTLDKSPAEHHHDVQKCISIFAECLASEALRQTLCEDSLPIPCKAKNQLAKDLKNTLFDDPNHQKWHHRAKPLHEATTDQIMKNQKHWLFAYFIKRAQRANGHLKETFILNHARTLLKQDPIFATSCIKKACEDLSQNEAESVQTIATEMLDLFIEHEQAYHLEMLIAQVVMHALHIIVYDEIPKLLQADQALQIQNCLYQGKQLKLDIQPFILHVMKHIVSSKENVRYYKQLVADAHCSEPSMIAKQVVAQLDDKDERHATIMDILNACRTYNAQNDEPLASAVKIILAFGKHYDAQFDEENPDNPSPAQTPEHPMNEQNMEHDQRQPSPPYLGNINPPNSPPMRNTVIPATLLHSGPN